MAGDVAVPNGPVLSRLSITQLIKHYLSTFVPGYAVGAELLSSRLGVDSEKLLAVVGFWMAGYAGFGYLKNIIIPHIASSFTSAVKIADTDYGHSSLHKWLRNHGAIQNKRLVWSEGWTHSNREDRSSNPPATVSAVQLGTTSALSKQSEGSRLFNYSLSKAAKPLEWSPEHGLYWFIHKWRPYMVQWNKNDSDCDEYGGFLKIYTLGYSTKPVEAIVQDAVSQFHGGRLSETNIWRACGSYWNERISRTCRPLNTVSIDTQLKKDLVTDINTFLAPGRSDWYAARGVPYRRGYLFHGPPGCGKTSLAFSLAGVFGLDVYIANLVSGCIDENELHSLIRNLPDRCILVIEDIDAVAVDRDVANKDANFRKSFDTAQRTYISLSGLLNAVDGFFSHEGHILIMTSNFPQHLDAAITRPGRCDRQVEFTRMSHAQISDMFVRIYGSTRTDPRSPVTLADALRPFEPDVSYAGCPWHTADELRTAGAEFATKFPDQVFSPAILQEFLIEHFEDPVRAIEEAPDFVKRTQEKQAAREKAAEEADQEEQNGEEENNDEENQDDANKPPSGKVKRRRWMRVEEFESEDEGGNDDDGETVVQFSRRKCKKCSDNANTDPVEKVGDKFAETPAVNGHAEHDETPAKTNGEINGHAEVLVNGDLNSHAEPQINGHADTQTNGHAESQASGNIEPQTNGHAEPNTNGSLDVQTHGTDTSTPAAQVNGTGSHLVNGEAKAHARATMEALVNGYGSALHEVNGH